MVLLFDKNSCKEERLLSVEGIKGKGEGTFFFFFLNSPQTLCKLSALSWQIMRKNSYALEEFSKSAREA